jgi:hypothetical protein
MLYSIKIYEGFKNSNKFKDALSFFNGKISESIIDTKGNETFIVSIKDDIFNSFILSLVYRYGLPFQIIECKIEIDLTKYT